MPVPSPMLTEGFLNSMVLDTDYNHYAILYHCSDKIINKINSLKGESIYIYGRENSVEKMPKEARDKLVKAFDRLFKKQGDFNEFTWAHVDQDFTKENHEACTEYPFIGKVEEKKVGEVKPEEKVGEVKPEEKKTEEKVGEVKPEEKKTEEKKPENKK